MNGAVTSSTQFRLEYRLLISKYPGAQAIPPVGVSHDIAIVLEGLQKPIRRHPGQPDLLTDLSGGQAGFHIERAQNVSLPSAGTVPKAHFHGVGLL